MKKLNKDLEKLYRKKRAAVDAAFQLLASRGYTPKHACNEIRFWYALEDAIDEYDKARQETEL